MMECGNQDKEALGHEGKRETLKEAYTLGRERLRQAGVPEADLDAWYLLESVTKITRASYLMEPDREMTERQSSRYEECISKREQRVPLGAGDIKEGTASSKRRREAAYSGSVYRLRLYPAQRPALCRQV